MSDYFKEDEGFIPNDKGEEAPEPIEAPVATEQISTEPVETPTPTEQISTEDIHLGDTAEIPLQAEANQGYSADSSQNPYTQQTVNTYQNNNQGYPQQGYYGNTSQQSTPYYGYPQNNAPANSSPYVSNPQWSNPQQPSITNSQGGYQPNTPPQYPQYGGMPPITPQPKKPMSGGLKAVLIGVVVLFLLFVFGIGFFIVTGVTTARNNYNNNHNDYGSSSSSNYNSSDDVFAGDPNGPSIDIDDSSAGSSSEYSAQYAYEKVSPSVVGIIAYDADADDITEGTSGSQGTGIIVSKDGYIVTNSHVINNSKSYTIKVILAGTEDEISAKVIGYDTRTDLAVLKIDKNNLTPATFGDSDSVKVGQDVVAIGNPGGIQYSNSLTRGIISALNRTVASSNVSYLQTDAAINPGNSGGPLCSLNGQVIGINTIKVVDTEFEGMGFAIPSVTVKSIVDDIIKQGYVTGRVRIGITGREITSTAAELYNVPTGIMIGEFSGDSPLPKAGAEKDDIITALNGTDITSFNQFYSELANYEPGDEVTLTLYRITNEQTGKGETKEIKIKLLEDKGETQSTSSER